MIYSKEIEIIDESTKKDANSAESYFVVQVTHMLKIMYQTEKWTSNSWSGSINNALEHNLELCSNTNVRKRVEPKLDDIYRSARKKAANETKLDISVFPEERDKDIFNINNLTNKTYIEDFYKKYEDKKNGKRK